MKTKLLLTALLTFALSACITTQQAKDGVELSVDTYIVAKVVDETEKELGKYSINQSTIKGLEQLQNDIEASLKDGTALLKIDEFHKRGVTIYNTLNAEAIARNSELNNTQRALLRVLNKSLINLDDKIKAFKNDTDNTDLIKDVGSLVDMVLTAKSIMLL